MRPCRQTLGWALGGAPKAGLWLPGQVGSWGPSLDGVVCWVGLLMDSHTACSPFDWRPQPCTPRGPGLGLKLIPGPLPRLRGDSGAEFTMCAN